MSTFDDAVNDLLTKWEGSGVIPDDHGRGPSKYGVTLKTAQQFYPNWTAENIENLTKDQAAGFYHVAFWEDYHYDQIHDPHLAAKVFNEAVNLGGPTANKILQRCVGAHDDGVIGPGTLGAVNGGDPVKILECFKEGCEARHKEVAEKYPELAGNLQGWLARDEA